ELLNTRCSQCSTVLSKAAVVGADIQGIGVEADGIRDVEDIPGKLQRHSLINLPGFCQARVDSKKALTTESIADSGLAGKRKAKWSKSRGDACCYRRELGKNLEGL